MKVLLTGASGFVGSHILDHLLAQGIAVKVLLRRTASTRHIARSLLRTEICEGGLGDVTALRAALRGTSHVIHCAGCTKALRRSDYFEANEQGTRNLVDTMNAAEGGPGRLVLVSSMAAAGPATSRGPAREDDPAGPISDYGRSKLAGENVVRDSCKVPWVILRPPAVYGPRDADFLTLFRAVRARVMPEFDGGGQELSLVFVEDLAGVVLGCLRHPVVVQRTYYVAHPEVVTSRALSAEIARQMGIRLWPVPVPGALLWPVCAVAELGARLRGRAGILNLQKYPELRARSWACSGLRLRQETGMRASTALGQGITATLGWYRRQGWLP